MLKCMLSHEASKPFGDCGRSATFVGLRHSTLASCPRRRGRIWKCVWLEALICHFQFLVTQFEVPLSKSIIISDRHVQAVHCLSIVLPFTKYQSWLCWVYVISGGGYGHIGPHQAAWGCAGSQWELGHMASHTHASHGGIGGSHKVIIIQGRILTHQHKPYVGQSLTGSHMVIIRSHRIM